MNLILIIIFFKKIFLRYIILIPIIFFFFVSISYIQNKNTIERYLDVRNILTNKSIVFFSATHEKHYKSAYKIFLKNKTFGSGLKTFRNICKKPEFNPDGCTTHPHNIIMQFLSELGLIGIIFYIIGFGYFLFKIINFFINKYYKNILIEKSYQEIILVTAFLINLWPLSPSGNFFNNWISILTFLPIGFLIYYEDNKV